MENLKYLIERYDEIKAFAVLIKADVPELSFFEACQLAIGIEKNSILDITLNDYDREETVTTNLGNIFNTVDLMRDDLNERIAEIREDIKNM